MEWGILSLEDSLGVCDFVREEMIKPDGGLLKEVHDVVATLGHCRRSRRLSSEASVSWRVYDRQCPGSVLVGRLPRLYPLVLLDGS